MADSPKFLGKNSNSSNCNNLSILLENYNKVIKETDKKLKQLYGIL